MIARARWETAQRWYEVELVCDLLGIKDVIIRTSALRGEPLTTPRPQILADSMVFSTLLGVSNCSLKPFWKNRATAF
jgi:hypothetical protein